MNINKPSAHYITFSALVLFSWLGLGCSERTSGHQRATSPSASGQVTASVSSPEASDSIDWKMVDQEMGRSGKEESGDVRRYSFPRSDLTVTCQGVKIKPALSLGSWLAFKPAGGRNAIAMGDLVLTEAEYNRVIARLLQGGISPTAVHKHLPAQTPALWWTHVEAEGDPTQIARTVRAALSLTKTPPALPNQPQQQPLDIDTAGISRALGHSGKVSGGVFQVSIPRAQVIRVGRIEIPASMGTATALNFQPTGGGKAAINGDLVMIAGEVKGVLRALELNGIQVVALHNHMLDEEPRLFFLHFWANDDAVKLARGLRSGLDQMHLAGGSTPTASR
jgi:hypothetical protein